MTPEQVERWVPSACVLCSNGCGLDIAAAGGRMVGVRGRAGDRDTDLVGVVKACEAETATQLKWLKTRMKQAAPQALVVAS